MGLRHCSSLWGDLKEIGNSLSNTTRHYLISSTNLQTFMGVLSTLLNYITRQAVCVWVCLRVYECALFVCFLNTHWMKSGSQAESFCPLKESPIPLPLGSFESESSSVLSMIHSFWKTVFTSPYTTSFWALNILTLRGTFRKSLAWINCNFGHLVVFWWVASSSFLDRLLFDPCQSLNFLRVKLLDWK